MRVQRIECQKPDKFCSKHVVNQNQPAFKASLKMQVTEGVLDIPRKNKSIYKSLFEAIGNKNDQVKVLLSKTLIDKKSGIYRLKADIESDVWGKPQSFSKKFDCPDDLEPIHIVNVIIDSTVERLGPQSADNKSLSNWFI